MLGEDGRIYNEACASNSELGIIMRSDQNGEAELVGQNDVCIKSFTELKIDAFHIKWQPKSDQRLQK